MGKAHAVAFSAVGAVFGTRLRPRLEMVAASSPASAERYREAFGFRCAADDWEALVRDPAVEAVVIASPPDTHLAITELAASLGKHVFCEKPLGASLSDGEAMLAAAERAGVIHMIGFNYIRTPASQFARRLIADGAIGDVTWMRGEHTEDFLADPYGPATWRTEGEANGTMGDLAPHMVNAALALLGPIDRVMAEIETVHDMRSGRPVTNDDQGQFMCRFANGVMGHLFFSRVATGRKMGYAYEITGTKGAIAFDQERMGELHYFKAGEAAAREGFKRILIGPAHPDFVDFCLGAGHGLGYNDQIVIEARDFVRAIATGETVWPSFRDGYEVDRIVDAVLRSQEIGAWVSVSEV